MDTAVWDIWALLALVSADPWRDSVWITGMLSPHSQRLFTPFLFFLPFFLFSLTHTLPSLSLKTVMGSQKEECAHVYYFQPRVHRTGWKMADLSEEVYTWLSVRCLSELPGVEAGCWVRGITDPR